jgi:uncharacterized protein with HEPN domain
MKNRKFADKERIRHIQDAIEYLEEFTYGYDFEAFAADIKTLSACIRQLEVMGEAANHVSKATQDNYPETPWKDVIALRNLLIHEYFGVNPAIVWDIVKFDIPNFKPQIKKMLEELPEQ